MTRARVTRRDFLKLTGGAALAAAAGGVRPPVARGAAEVLRVGMPLPLTGFVAESARDMDKGFKLYLEQSGQKLGGIPVRLYIEDTEAVPQNALTKMIKLVRENEVHLVCGYLLAFEGYAVRDYVDHNHVPLFLPIVAADDLTQRKRSPWIIRMTWTSSLPNHPLGEYAYKTLKYRRMATIGQDYAFGWENVGGFQRTFEASGGQVLQKLWAPIDTTDYGPYITQLRRDVDAVYVLLVGADIPRFFKQYRDFGLTKKIPIVGGNIMTDEDVLRHMGDEALGVITSHTYSAEEDRSENQRFVKAFRTRYNLNPSYYAESMYTAAMWLDRALRATGRPTDKEGLVKAVKQTILPDAPRCPLRIDSYNSTIETVRIRRTVRRGGQLQNEVIESIPDVSQFWHFDPKQYLAQSAYNRAFPACRYCR